MSPWVLGMLAALALALALVLLRPPSWSAGRRPAVPSVRWRGPRRAAADRRRAELEWLDSVAAELSAGQDPAAALVAVPASAAVCPHALAAARVGTDVGRALAHDGERSPTVRASAACWQVAAGSGAGLAASFAVLADAAREDERVRAELDAGVAEPRATALVLAGLPLVGLALGAGLGAEPLVWLLGTTPGHVVLLAGLVLEAAGAAWAWRIATSLEDAL